MMSKLETDTNRNDVEKRNFIMVRVIIAINTIDLAQRV